MLILRPLRFRVPSFVVLGVLLLAFARPAFAHLGPPYPVIEDQPVPGYLVSVWINPDVWRAACYVKFQPTRPDSPDAPLPSVSVWVRPASGRAPRQSVSATLDSRGEELSFYCQPVFDAPELFKLGVDLKLPDGTPEHLLTELEATPPGIGPWGLLLFVVPFLLFGGLFIAVLFRRKRLAAARRRVARAIPRPPPPSDSPGRVSDAAQPD